MWLTSAGPTWSCNEAPFSLLRAFLDITEWSCYILDPQSSHPPSLRTLLPQLTMIWQTTGHLLCCNFPLVWHAPPILWSPFIVGPFYIHLRPPIRTYRKLNCMKLMKGVVLLDSEEKLPHFVWRPCGWVCRISAVDLKTNVQRKPLFDSSRIISLILNIFIANNFPKSPVDLRDQMAIGRVN